MKQFWLWLPLKSRLLCQILPNYNLSFPQLLSLPGRGIAIEQVFVHSEGNDNVEQQVGWQDHQNFHLLFGFPVDLHQGQVGCGVFKLVLSSKRMSQKDFFVYFKLTQCRAYKIGHTYVLLENEIPSHSQNLIFIVNSNNCHTISTFYLIN